MRSDVTTPGLGTWARAGLTLAAGVALWAAGATAAVAQEKVPRLARGVPVVVVPVQQVLPTPAGAWPGGAGSRREAIRQVNAEMDFAVGEATAADAWVSPGEVVRQAGRNPILDVDPNQLAYRGLLSERDSEKLYEPLQSQLRSLAALLDARIVALPLVAWYGPTSREEDGDTGGGSGDPSASAADGAAGLERARIRIALVDVRRGHVLWKGEVAGAKVPADSPGALATLAANVVAILTGS